MFSTRQIDFLGIRNFSFIISGTLLLISIVSLFAKGLNLGIDFTGGTLLEVHYPNSVELTQMRTQLTEKGFVDASIQHFGSSEDVLIRLKPIENIEQKELGQKVLAIVNQSQTTQGDLRRVEFVGPQVGDELMNDGGIAILLSLLGVMIYVSARFEWKFSVGAVLALTHDVLITLGFFAFFGWEFDMTVLSALLAIIGYSINDTIVVYDRIRETLCGGRNGPIDAITNTALNDTLSRTILTSLTVFLTVIALLLLGGKTIHGFAVAMLIGVVVGTYSSIYIASSLALALGLDRDDLLAPEKKSKFDDNMP
ncbi:MAG: protein translocase subunit SecF [Gammaproteobacteria bacterium HGW-Gammaproteobacteria-10]|nr:MAG: protein translocase subunit SecF [Gammaproteobacteria bacterium HGW-Gammaproteobacteria-10]HBA67643.1 protein translocase subunit SecF [Methylococcaceae bacterium]